MVATIKSFSIRIDEEDGIDLAAFDEAAKERGTGREELVRQLMRNFLHRLDADEQYYTIKGYNQEHSRYADIRNMDGLVNWHEDGFEYNSPDWRVLEHAVDLVERSEPGDKEEAINLFKGLFGERNVFVKSE